VAARLGNLAVPLDLAGLLVEAGAADPDAVERALARQREVGGALDTALLELGVVDDGTVALFLSRASGLPPPPAGAVDPDPRARRVFPARVAERHALAPFRLDGQELSLLAAHPVDLAALDELSFMLSLRLVPYVAAEWRVRELQSRLYGAALPERLAAVAEGVRRAARAAEAAPAATPAPVADPPPPETPEFAVAAPAAEAAPVNEPPPGGEEATAAAAAADADAAFAIDEALEAASARDAAATAAPAEPPRGPFGVVPEDPLALALAQAGEALDDAGADASGDGAPRWTVEEAFAALGAARDRDEIVAVLLRYARDFFDAAALFAVAKDRVAGQDASGWPSARERCRAVHVAVEAVALFRAAIAAAGPYLGPVARDETSAQLLAALGRPWPHTALVYPILLRDRAVCVLYADNGDAPVSPGRIGDLLLVLGAAGAAFERVLRDAKRARGAAAPASGESPSASAAPPPRAAPPEAPPHDRVMEPPLPHPEADEAHVEWEAREPGRLPAPPAGPVLEVPEEAYAVASAGEALGPAEPFEAQRAVAALVASRRGSGDRARAVARIVQHGPEAAAALKGAFPGPQDPGAEGRPVAERGPVLAAFAALGSVASPYLIALLSDPDPARRALAAELLGRAGDAAALLPLAEAVLDRDPAAARAALAALAALRGHPEFHPVLDRLRGALLGGDAERPAQAARALARLGDAETVPLLVEGLRGGPQLAHACIEALEVLTARRFGDDAAAWVAWWRAHRAEGRAEWLFSALADEDRDVRAAAAARLREAGPAPVDYSPDLPAPARAQAARAWREWWAGRGAPI
jgi:type II secretion system (T2SS) protein E/HEAT repeat protein